ncbi:MAG: nucleotidyl transferase AbiEii/AbiGii toxin family protein [Deltaproteobacteria bacterium]|nr:nucleotidyl transferase AbiEii/AbiGii toxin family protein [Deltaproteobacteria bacterium]
MNLTGAELVRETARAGFQADVLEKVVRLFGLLEGLGTHAYLRPRLALKRGTALHLFHLDVPRLSVDVDLDYVGAVGRDEMLGERPKVDQAVEAVCRRLDLDVRHVPGEHAGGKWRLRYSRAMGGTGTLELDLNFLLRAPLWPPVAMDSRVLAGTRVHAVPVLDLHVSHPIGFYQY